MTEAYISFTTDRDTGVALQMTRAELEAVVSVLEASGEKPARDFGSSLKSLFRQQRLFGHGFGGVAA